MSTLMEKLISLILFSLFLIASAIITYTIVLVGTGQIGPLNNGIIPHEDGTAVYLESEACVINADSTVSTKAFEEKLEWCAHQLRIERDR